MGWPLVPDNGGSLTSQTDVVITSKAGGVSGDIVFKQGVSEVARFHNGNLTLDGALTVIGAMTTDSQVNISGAIAAGVSTAQPIINFNTDINHLPGSGAGQLGGWQVCLDTSNSVNGDFVPAARINPDGSVSDLIYVRSYADVNAVGVGYTPPPDGHRLSVSAPDNGTIGKLLLRSGVSDTGPFISAINSAGTTMFRMASTASLRGPDSSISTTGLTVVDNGDDGSQVLSVVGRTSATADILRVNLAGQAGKWAIARDGSTNVQAVMTSSGGTAAITFRSQSTIAAFQANSSTDTIVNIKCAASQSGVPFRIQTSTPATLFQVAASGTVTLADAANIVLGTTTGTQIGTVGGASGQKIGFWNATPVVQPLLATGAAHTVDDVIATLQTLGLVRQS